MKMSYRMCTGFIVAGAAVGLAMGCGSNATDDGESQAAAVVSGTTTVMTGTTSDAAGTSQYKIEVPSPWNGTLVLYSHGYSFTPSPATDAPGGAVVSWLLDHGYAVAGSSYSTSGWAVEQAFQDQLAVLDVFDKSPFGHPRRTIAWGHSLGGLITAGLVQLFPERFTAALPMCGVVSGAPASWNEGLDGEFVLSTLVSPLKMVNFTAADVGTLAAPGPEIKKAEQVLAAAQGTAEGRARIALAAAMGNLPGWFDETKPEPARTDFAAREANQFQWMSNVDFLFGYFGRFELETRAGGVYSWNTGVDYREQLARSSDRAEVVALYEAAGLDLEKDLNRLNRAPRIAANPKAVAYLSRFIAFDGDIDIPVLTMHTTGDGLVDPTQEQAYASAVRRAGDRDLLRQVFVHRAGHCTFTAAETISAFQTLIHRIDAGHWRGTHAGAMNARAEALGSGFDNIITSGNPSPPSFIEFEPTPFLRPFE